MRRISIWGIILGAFFIFPFFGNSAYGQQITIAFDELSLGDDQPLPLNQYTNLGVQFSSEVGGTAFVWNWGSYSTVQDTPSGGVYSSPIAIKGSSGLANISVIATFVDPASGQPATTSFVQVVACSGPGGDTLSYNVALKAFNSSNIQIAEDLADTTQQYDWLSVSAPGIAKVVMVAGPDLEIFDNFTFETVSSYFDDQDNDGVFNDDDNCMSTPNPDQIDSDFDGIGDACDNCWNVSNPDQLNANSDCPSPPYAADPECGDACGVVGDLPEGMISYWKFDEGSGSSSSDSVGNNDGTIVGATWTTGQVGGALQFDGYHHVTVPNHETLNPSLITVEAWVYPTSYGYYRTMVTKRYYQEPDWYAPYTAYQLDPLSYNTLRPGFYVAIGGAPLINTTPENVTIDLGNWYHLVGTYDGDKTRIYLNGDFIIEKDVPNNGIDWSSGPLYIGDVPDSNNRFYGKIDEVAIYNRALTQAEIRQHYQNGLNGLGYEYQDSTDTDGDGIADSADNCWSVSNPDQSDTNGDCPSPPYAADPECGDACGVVGDFPEGIISYWKFEDCTATDTVGSNDGIIDAGISCVDGKVGKALDFSDQYHVTIPDHPSLKPDFLSLEVWFSPTNYAGYRSIVNKPYISTPWVAPWNLYYLMLQYSTLKPEFAVTTPDGSGGIRQRVTNTQPVIQGEWSHFVGTYDGSALKAYINGSLVDSKDVTATGPIDNRYSIAPLYFGGVPYTNNYYYGKIDEVAIYNRALTPAEIQQHYQNGLNGLGYEYQDSTDTDGDGFADSIDNCPGVANADQADTDTDGIGDACDNCWNVSNPEQSDTNGDCPSPPYSADPECGDACSVDGSVLEEDFESVNPGQIPDGWWSIDSWGNHTSCSYTSDHKVREIDGNKVLSLTADWAALAGPADIVLLDYAVEADAYTMLHDVPECCDIDTRGASFFLRSSNKGTEHLRGGYIIYFDPVPDNRVYVIIADYECSGNAVIGETYLDDMDFTLEAGEWYKLKASVTGDTYGDIKIRAYINDMTTPVLEVVDDGSAWGTGSSCYEGNLPGYTALSGYYAKNYYDNVRIFEISQEVTDTDGDGYSSDVDCDDNNPAIYPYAPELCNNIDDNCDGSVDEGLIRPTSCGVGVCVSTGTETCSAGSWVGDTCTAGSPSAEVCDNIDNDCDGSVDEGLIRPTSCGVGACAANTGQEACTAGVWGADTCDPLAGAEVEICDNTDNDCDGTVDEGFDIDNDGIVDCLDDCPNDPNNDADSDEVCGDVDNCPAVANAGQSDIDGSGLGDLCDPCPADPLDGCNQDGSTAEEIPADQGGTVETPDGDLSLDIGSEDLGSDTTISVTETVPQDPAVDLMVGVNPGLGQAVAVYDLQPDELQFANPITLTAVAEVTELNANQRNRLNLYIFTDTDQNGFEDSFVPIEPPANCTIVENPPNSGTIIATCIAEVHHFSSYAILAPLDSDDDGVADMFGVEQDYCPSLPAQESMSMDYTGDLVLPIDQTGFATVEAAADLYKENGEPLPGMPVSMSCTDSYGNSYGEECTELETDDSGIATCSIMGLVPGVYSVEVLSDKSGCPGASTEALLAVYDPNGGFVTGGGWINSPAGAYTLDLGLTGKATFGFVSKYKMGAATPTGETEFQFKVADLNFHSDTYDWLVIAGSKAMYKGTGTINGTGDYGFMLSAIDGKLTPSTDVDLFRIKIWDKDSADGVVYDNQTGADEDADPTTAIGGGSIVIHTSKIASG
jgi:hypothetical protein